jgi:glutamyl-tRNA synthetase
VVSKKWNDDAVKVLTAYKQEIQNAENLDAVKAKALLEKVTASLNIGIGKVLQAVRLSITGAGAGPDLMVIIEILGKEEVVRRVDYALQNIKASVV